MGRLAKYDSQFVSTGSYGMLKKISPVFAQQVLNTYLYKINTKLSLGGGNFYDANHIFDRSGIKRPYATQREWVKSGSIPGKAVVEYMHGKTYWEQYDSVKGAPDEKYLEGWITML